MDVWILRRLFERVGEVPQRHLLCPRIDDGDLGWIPGSNLGRQWCCTRVSSFCCSCCGWCWCEATWSVPQHRLDGRTAPPHHCTTAQLAARWAGLVGGSNVEEGISLWGGPWQGRQEERGQVGSVGHWLLATHTRMPPSPTPLGQF